MQGSEKIFKLYKNGRINTLLNILLFNKNKEVKLKVDKKEVKISE